jgi:hypothetical protein
VVKSTAVVNTITQLWIPIQKEENGQDVIKNVVSTSGSDHSKYGYTYPITKNDKPWVCVGGNNRQVSQYARGDSTVSYYLFFEVHNVVTHSQVCVSAKNLRDTLHELTLQRIYVSNFKHIHGIIITQIDNGKEKLKDMYSIPIVDPIRVPLSNEPSQLLRKNNVAPNLPPKAICSLHNRATDLLSFADYLSIFLSPTDDDSDPAVPTQKKSKS